MTRILTISMLSALAVAMSLGAMHGDVGPAANAAVPTGTPTFSNPLNFTNTYFPFQPGGMKIYEGKTDGEPLIVVDVYTTETRTFQWNGQSVECRLMKEMEFEDGEILEISWNYFAQADDGSVYYFGELVDEYDDGQIVHEGAWLVGGPATGEEAATATDPALFMPANVAVGDIWKPENLPAADIDETDEAIRLDKKVRVPAGKFRNCLEVRELDFDGETEKKWYAPGIGVVKGKAEDEKFKLIAMTYAAD